MEASEKNIVMDEEDEEELLLLLGGLETREEDELKKKVEHRVTLYTPPPPFPSSLTSSNQRSFLETNTDPHMAIPHGAYTPPWHNPARVALFSSACSFWSQRPSISGKSRAGTRLRGRIVAAEVCKRRYVRMCFWWGCLVLEACIPNASVAFS